MSEYLPNVYTEFREKFPEVADNQDELAASIDQAGPLDDKTSRLVKLGIALGGQADGAVRSNVRKALKAGASREEVEHAILLGLTTRGFPATVAAWQWMNEVVDED
ncbi:carboxymuconolactone decarboxylase family protein [Flaviflexus ciconiae]|uniref:Carboxymuconolactone decarboxylase family protein n=1 Tax=Flaviflexus ciconiae TaxID=2496867 RepID=A0A3Q9G458_9ACTO|nr:carboxymuconolactone decarboxylase family protein [Flaviflexus ciconiae]AZQ76944.1 carboxymuconolactone decarboxylase family protein [Flaviflexus ciconiae]